MRIVSEKVFADSSVIEFDEIIYNFYGYYSNKKGKYCSKQQKRQTL